MWYAEGGTGALVDALVRLFEELGGEVRLGTEVTRIRVRGRRATGSNSRAARCSKRTG
ncbi:FAD-dependent oxidoreductase [Tepidiforma flava]|uniref:FAD-dependent oxidoreductase n=1 Tax=Tepidiforma flava TaxID=3004094 RepID=A0ABY7M762_9CHLR|nr:FAD-dependent oxidoreductase [Tepidiforma flava]WBL36365.1 FAD-dependent oxidoreductase [Tepidiforma flava]